MNFKALYTSNKQRVFTGLVMVAFAAVIAFLNNALLTWLILGVMYMFAFYEAMNLFEIKDNKLFVYAVLLWLAAFIYPNPDDLIYLALIGSLSVMAYTKKLDYKLLAPFFYPFNFDALFVCALPRLWYVRSHLACYRRSVDRYRGVFCG